MSLCRVFKGVYILTKKSSLSFLENFNYNDNKNFLKKTIVHPVIGEYIF